MHGTLAKTRKRVWTASRKEKSKSEYTEWTGRAKGLVEEAT